MRKLVSDGPNGECSLGAGPINMHVPCNKLVKIGEFKCSYKTLSIIFFDKTQTCMIIHM